MRAKDPFKTSSKEKWATLKDQPMPWYVRLDPLRLILME
jgi:molybdate transport system permease protein